MNRFERRLKQPGSPRPGTATCKITRNKKIDNNTIVNDEINNQKNISNDIIIEDVQKQNAKIVEKLKTCRNQAERIMLNHEMRLNTIELNVDCLNNLEENEVTKENMEILKNNMDYLLNENNKLKEDIQNITKKMNLMVQMNNSSTLDNQEKVVLDVKEVIDKEKNKNEEKSNDLEENPTFA